MVDKVYSKVVLPEESEIVYRPIQQNGKLFTHININFPAMIHHFLHTATLIPNRPCLGFREPKSDGTLGDFSWHTYSEVNQLSADFASGLAHLQLVEQVFQDDSYWRFLGVSSVNRLEWGIILLACQRQKVTLVPMYHTFPVDNFKVILNDTTVSTVCCSNDVLENLLEARQDCPNLQNLILLDDISEENRDRALQFGISIYSFNDILQAGRENPTNDNLPQAKDPYMLSYTSGTTGVPKGVVLTYENFISAFIGIIRLGCYIHPKDRYLSYLPFAHVFEQIMFNASLMLGGQVGFFNGDVQKLSEDLQMLKPTIFASVPRLYNRIYDGIMDKINNSSLPVRLLAKLAIWVKTQNLKHDIVSHWLFDKLVFKKINAALGGCIRLQVTGSAPISPDVLNFFSIANNCVIMEAYGQTENTGAAFVSHKIFKEGNVGNLLHNFEFKLDSVPDMKYTTKDIINGRSVPRGEVCIRGPSVTRGYFRREKDTKATIDNRGWLHTGDIAMLLPDGALKVVDRKKNLFKLAQGEYIAPEKLENAFIRSTYVMQLMVHGDANKTFCIAIVVPEMEQIRRLYPGLSDEQIRGKAQDIKSLIMKDFKDIAKQGKFNSLETPKNILLEFEPFSIEKGLLTDTLKVKRYNVKEEYARQIEALYQEPPMAQTFNYQIPKSRFLQFKLDNKI